MYTPSLKDLNVKMPAVNEGYTPSLADLNVQPENIQNIPNNPVQPKPLMQKHFELSKMLPMNDKNLSLAETIPGITDPHQLGKAALEAGGLAASLAQPEVGLLAKLIPNAPRLVNGLLRMAAQSGYGAASAPENPAIGGGMGAFGSALTQLSGVRNPFFNALIRALTGGTLGGGAGFALSGPSGIIPGASAGATAGIALPYTKMKLGIGAVNPEAQIINQITPEEVYKRARAANALNTSITPGEASGRADVTAQEAQLGRVGEGATERINLGNQRLAEQKNAISNLQSTISPSKKNALLDTREAARNAISAKQNALQQKVNPLYRQAEKEIVAPDRLEKLSASDKTIENAIKSVRSDPAYMAELQGYEPNSIKVLDLAKRKIDDDIESAISSRNFDRARVLRASRDRLINATDEFSPTYKEARRQYSEGAKPIEALRNSKLGQIADVKDVGVKNISKMIFDPAQTDINVLRQVRDEIRAQNPEAWDNLINNELTRLMSKGEVKGTTFYKKVLENDNVFNQLMTALDHNPEAKRNLIHMRRAWKDLTNIESPRQGHGLTATGMKQARNDISALIDMYAQITNSEADIKALNTIYTREWQNKLNQTMQIRDRRRRSAELGRLLSTALRGALSTLAPKEE